VDGAWAGRGGARDKPVFVAANKVDTAQIVDFAGEFHRFGYEDVFPISAEHGVGLGDLLDAVIERLPAVEVAERERSEINVAVIGRPNVGKSSLINKLLGEERGIVSHIPGTTRDAGDSVFEAQVGPVGEDGETVRLRLIDTEGIRRKGKTTGMEEKLSVVMARKHIERADVALLLIDAVEGVTALDANIAGYAHEAGR